MGLRGREQCIVFDVPHIAVGPPRNIGDKLPEPLMWIAVAKLGDGPVRFVLRR
jgi:hypothetical protein